MGYVEKHHGKYRARYRDASGRLRSRSFTLKADAERFVREEEVALERGSWVDPRAADMTLGEWCERFMSLARRLADTTQQTYRRDLGRYVLPKFGTYRLGRLRAEEIEEWLLDEIDSGLAPSSVHRHYRTLHRVLEVAVKHKRLASNPCAGVQPPSVPRRRMVILDWPQVFDLADGLPDRYRALIFLAVDSGMRWSELVGLRRRSVDLRRGKVRVTEQLIRLGAGEWLRKEPKTPSSVRSITISPETTAILAAHLERFGTADLDGLVFTNSAGNPLISSSFWQHYFQPALQRAGLSSRFHDLRHTSVALAIAEGAHPKAIQTRMGHSSINVTLDRYGHLFPELDEALAASFGKRLAEARQQQAERPTIVHASVGQ